LHVMVYSVQKLIIGNESSPAILAHRKGPSMAKTVIRRNIELQPQAIERLERLKEKLEATTDSEVLRRALKVLEQVVEEEENGKRVLIRESNGDLVSVLVL
jgi:hypothetical protein